MEEFKVHGEKSLEIKRFYLPIKFSVNCPHCGASNEKDFDDDYLSYPTINKKEAVYMCCDNCDDEYEFDVCLSVGLEVDNKARKI